MRNELVIRAQDGDREAFATLATESIGRLFTTANLMLRDRDLADDAVQETLVLAWRDLKGLRDPGGYDAWVNRILVRTVYREARRERRRSAPAGLVRDLVSAPDSAGVVADRDALARGFGRLRPEHRAVLVLRHYLGYSDNEAADALLVPAGTFKSRLNRATSALRAELDADARTTDRLAVESVR
jgi:RNA polymerase sigma-70 factor (ECF subfamily)